METIKVKDLEIVNVLSTTDSIPVLTDDIDNVVQRVNFENLALSLMNSKGSSAITKYENDITYKANQWVLDGSIIYKSLVDDNIGHSTTDENYWEEVELGGGGGLEICDIGQALYIDESKGLRRYLNGTTVAINTNTQAFLDKLKQIVALYPSLATTEENWQAEKTLSVHGQCGKFVINETAGTIRLPRIITPIQGLTDLSKLGEMLEQSLPNINGVIGHSLNLGNGGSNTSGAFNLISGGGSTSGGSTSGGSSFDFDASRSSSIYKDGAPVQQEQIQYPYFIQIATGSETEVNIVNEIELNNPFTLLDCKYSEYKLNNISWLISQGQRNSGVVFVDAYNEILKEYNNPDRLAKFNRSNFTIVGNPSITSYGFASGFSSNDYVKIENISLANNFEIQGNFTIGNSFGGLPIELMGSPSAGYNVRFEIKSSGVGFFFYVNGGWIDNTTFTFALNTEYHYKIVYNGTNISFYLAVKNNPLVNYVDTNWTQYTVTGLNIGLVGGISWGGSIDLKQFSIKGNNQHIFSGADSMVKSVSDSSATDYDFKIDTATQEFILPIKSHLASGKAVVGNGMALGLTDGAVNYGLGRNSTTGFNAYSKSYGVNIGSTPDTAITVNKTLGITTDGTKSGIETDTTGLYLYYYVGETVQNANLIDAGRIQEQISEIKTHIYIIDKWQQDSEGYRIWSDGYCEQWGTYGSTSNNTPNSNQTITFLKKFANTNYTLMFSHLTSSSTEYNSNIKGSTMTTDSFVLTTQKGINFWKATGYLAEGEY